MTLKQTAGYGRQLEIEEMNLAVFVESIPDEIRGRLEKVYTDKKTGINVIPFFIETGK